MPNISLQPFAGINERFLLHVDDTNTENLKKLAESELNENAETRSRCLEALRSLLKNEIGLRPQNDDLFLLAFLRARKFNVERAFSLVRGFYSTIGKYSDIFYITPEDVQKTLEQNCLYFLPRRNNDGCTVTMFRISSWNPTIVSPEELISSGSVGLFHAFLNSSTQIAGLKVILDLKGFSFSQLLHVKPSHLWIFGEMVQNTFPMRMRGLHIVNENHFFDYIWAVLQKFLSKKLKDRVHFHGKDMKSLHKHINPSILPAEYGGEQPAFDNSDWRRKIEACFSYTNHVFSFGYEKYLKKQSTENDA